MRCCDVEIGCEVTWIPQDFDKANWVVEVIQKRYGHLWEYCYRIDFEVLLGWFWKVLSRSSACWLDHLECSLLVFYAFIFRVPSNATSRFSPTKKGNSGWAGWYLMLKPLEQCQPVFSDLDGPSTGGWYSPNFAELQYAQLKTCLAKTGCCSPIGIGWFLSVSCSLAHGCGLRSNYRLPNWLLVWWSSTNSPVSNRHDANYA